MSNKNKLGMQYMKEIRRIIPTLIGKRGTAQESRKWKKPGTVSKGGTVSGRFTNSTSQATAPA